VGLEVGSKVLVQHRRMFETDRSRYFVGSVSHASNGVASLLGRSWVQDPFSGDFRPSKDARTKLLSLSGSPGVITYQLPPDLNLNQLKIETVGADKTVLTDGAKFQMELPEN